jgi:hypothetical protein
MIHQGGRRSRAVTRVTASCTPRTGPGGADGASMAARVGAIGWRNWTSMGAAPLSVSNRIGQ